MDKNKTYQIIFKFSDVIREIKASSEDQANVIAENMILEGIKNLTEDSGVYGFEVEEIK